MRYHVRWGAIAEDCRIVDRDSWRPFGSPIETESKHTTPPTVPAKLPTETNRLPRKTPTH